MVVQGFFKQAIMILRLLKKVFFSLRNQKRNRFNRVLPVSELITDRWEKARYLSFGTGTSIYDNSYIFGNVKVGANTWIGPFTILDGSGGLSIGDNCSLSAGVQIYTHDTVKWAITGGKADYEYAETKIGSSVYIGPNSIIAKGVIIGDRCIIGANSFVNKSFPDDSKIAGSPAKKIS